MKGYNNVQFDIIGAFSCQLFAVKMTLVENLTLHRCWVIAQAETVFNPI
jgi:hypothetical protein